MRATTVSPFDRPGSSGAVAPVTALDGRARPAVALTFPAARDAGRQRLVTLLRRLAQLRPEVGAAGLDDHDLLDPAVIGALAGRTTRPPGARPTRHDQHERDHHERDPHQGAGRIRLAASPIELVAASRTDGWPLLDDPGADVDWEATTATARALRTDLGRALDVVHRTQLGLHRAVEGSTRLVVTYTGDGPGSFAALAAHGALFWNCRPGDGLPYAIEELAHQGGHVLLTTLLFGREDEPFRVPADTAFAPSEPVTAAVEDRTVLVLLHAVFTEALMAASLWAALDDPLLTAIERHEVRGRLELVLRRFRHDLVDLLDADVLGPWGLALAARCREVFELTVGGWARHAEPCDLSGQPYAFCRRTFLDRNPAPPADHPQNRAHCVPAVAIT